MRDPYLHMLKQAGVKIPGVTDRKEMFTPWNRQRVLGRFQIQNAQLLKAGGFVDQDLEFMADDILKGYRNSGLHYKDFHREGQGYTIYVRVFAMLSRVLQDYRWSPSGLQRPRPQKKP